MTDASVDVTQVERLADDLKKLKATAFPYAVRNSLNKSAFEGRKVWVDELGRTFVLRNQFTTRSLRVERATGMTVNKMVAILGSVAPYMGTQESGGIERGKSGHSKPIPTAVAAGQAMGTRPRTKAVRRANWLTAIRIGKRPSVGKSAKQRNAITLRQAVVSGQRFTLLDTKHGKGLFRITGRKRLTVREVWDLSRKSVRVPKQATLQRTLNRLEPRLTLIHKDAIVDQMKRHRILGYR